jgi:hypothetical protein
MSTTLNPCVRACSGRRSDEGRTAVYSKENSATEPPEKPLTHLAVIAMSHVETQEVASVRRFAESKAHQFDPN